MKKNPSFFFIACIQLYAIFTYASHSPPSPSVPLHNHYKEVHMPSRLPYNWENTPTSPSHTMNADGNRSPSAPPGTLAE